MFAGKIRIPPNMSKFCQPNSLACTLTMYLLSATGRSNRPYCSRLDGLSSVLSTINFQEATTSSDVTGVPSEKRAFGSIRNRNVCLSEEICQCVAREGMYLNVVG